MGLPSSNICRAAAPIVILQEVQKCSNNYRVHQINKQTTNQRNNKECAWGRTVLFVQGLHVCHCGRNSAEAKAALTGGHDCSIKVFTHNREGDKDREDCHQDNLGKEEKQEWKSKINKSPELHRHHRQCQEDQKRDVADNREFRQLQIKFFIAVSDISENSGSGHSSNGGRKLNTSLL